MSLKIEILNPAVQRQMPSQDGGTYTITEQKMALHEEGKKYPILFTGRLPDLSAAYEVGKWYTFTTESFGLKYDGLQMARYTVLQELDQASLKKVA